jgi:hypothetical protein
MVLQPWQNIESVEAKNLSCGAGYYEELSNSCAFGAAVAYYFSKEPSIGPASTTGGLFWRFER